MQELLLTAVLSLVVVLEPSFWTMLHAVAVRPLCCPVHIVALELTIVDIMKMLVLDAQVDCC